MLRQIGAFFGSLLAGEMPLPESTGPEVLGRCEEAYRSLDSYQGVTRIFQKSNRPGGRVYKASTHARIWYARPGNIRIEGTLPRDYASFHRGTFAIVSDGANTFRRWTVKCNLWKAADSAESAIAAFTGVSSGACSTIPALLLATQWGRPWRPSSQIQLEVTTERIRGVQAYRVEFTGRFARTTVWIDCRTLLLLRLQEIRDNAEIERAMGDEFRATQDKMLAQLPEDARNLIAKEQALGPGTTSVTETYLDVRTDAEIPAAAFKPVDRL